MASETRELAYDPAIDNCANMPGCGDQRVLFTWYGPAICCPRCYENLFGAAPDPGSVITLPAATPATDDAPAQAEVDRCGWSEDPFHRCRVCYDYATGTDRPARLAEARGCIRLNCGHPQPRHDAGRPGSPCEDCDCRAWVPPAGEAREHG